MSEKKPYPHKRRHTRTDLSLLVQYRFNTFEDFQAEYVSNLSPGGMFINTTEPIEEGTTIYLQFSLLDGSKLIEGLGRVARVIRGGPTPGMGVEFVDFDAESMQLIKEICRSGPVSPRDP